ncbi:MAG: sigma-70 family RNA polymerase sigma factor [Sphingomonadales bacterium]|nr:sigma-70 family RNA polymerase sigma factor [Sphingomonadales bacterium]NCO49753.1 sigma-70 family RNA polymerase sigma factor [Sphingomonadales bacterium]NCO99078.1 sigma-70 family RNA polymerase sigma factor [Sphingomonadales bacterium]NCP25407.1 sigma-70 family RNA polymerase sigma factor [Sphingomonadales bacterium]NCP44457.1 sigma-70 family RNA polymerase sigma factor [Sphingomonadales bacterium]
MTAPGSIASFDAFYRSENQRLLRFFGKRVGWDAAPDLVQDAFTRVLRSGAFERIDNPQAYLTRTARNLLIERARRRVREQNVMIPLDEGRDAPVQPEQTWQIEATDLRRVYRKALRAMPHKTRRIFLMHRLRCLTYNDIAEQIGIGESGVEYHMARALARCRQAVATLE